MRKTLIYKYTLYGDENLNFNIFTINEECNIFVAKSM